MAASDFRGASADALAELTAQVESAEDPRRTGSDLFAVASMVRSDGTLRRFLTDASLPAEAKTGLIGDVFGEHVSQSAHGVLSLAVEHKWTTSRDLPNALEQLSVIAIVTSTGSHGARLSDELFSVNATINEHGDLRNSLSDPARSMADKEQLVDDLLGDKAMEATVTLVKQAVSSGFRTVSVALTEYQRLAASVNDKRVATVRVARELSEADENRLGDALSRQYGMDVHLNVVVDPDILGGIKVEIGDDVIDGSVATKLDQARRKLVG